MRENFFRKIFHISKIIISFCLMIMTYYWTMKNYHSVPWSGFLLQSMILSEYWLFCCLIWFILCKLFSATGTQSWIFFRVGELSNHVSAGSISASLYVYEDWNNSYNKNKQTKQQTKKQKSERSLCPQQPGKSPEIYKNREIGGMTAEAFNVGTLIVGSFSMRNDI